MPNILRKKELYFMMYGYARISTKDQNEIRQLVSLREFGISDEQIFIDRQSGKDFNRTEYRKIIRRLKRGDILVVKSIDRLGRNYNEILEQWQHITKDIKADIVVLDMAILDTRQHKDLIGTLISDIVLQLLSYVAQNERETIRQRQAEGIAAAKARGVHFGRSQRYFPENYFYLYEKFKRKEIRQGQMIAEIGCCDSTYYRMLKSFKKMYKDKYGK